MNVKYLYTIVSIEKNSHYHLGYFNECFDLRLIKEINRLINIGILNIYLNSSISNLQLIIVLLMDVSKIN